MTVKKLRMYEPVWLTLKKHKTCTIAAPTAYHKRVIKAVIKEKWLDIDWKKKEGWRMMYLTWHTHADDPALITFKLSYRKNDLVAKDF